MMTGSVAVVAAHPDDEVLGCGGAIARHAAAGDAVHILILGEGVTSRHAKREDAPAEELTRLKQHARAAAAALGARQVEFGGLPDNRFDQVALLDIVKMVEAFLVRHSPAAIYTHHPGDLNVDHGLTFRAVLTASRPGVSAAHVRDLYAFEVPSSTEWAFQRIAPPFRPNVFIDITAGLETKIAAMQHYDSETRRPPHPRSPDTLRAAAARWGSVAGCAHAEAFELIRSIRPCP